MAPTSSPGFRVAVCGPSGAGKSTAARAVASTATDILWIEASRDLIEHREYDRMRPFETRSEEGVRYFERAVRVEGRDWAARRLLRAAEGRRNVLVTGIRGPENIRRLRDGGYFCVFFHAAKTISQARLLTREGTTHSSALQHLEREEQAFGLAEMAEGCDFTLDTSNMSEAAVERALANICLTVTAKESAYSQASVCTTCALPKVPPFRFETGGERCATCAAYEGREVSGASKQFLAEMLEEIGPGGSENALLGFSGGKDSTAALQFLLAKSRKVSTFTVDLGYYPITMLARAKSWAEKLGVDHVCVDGRQFISGHIYDSYELTAAFYDRLSSTTTEMAVRQYELSRRHYSAADPSAEAFPRVCVLCRKSVIRSYYQTARERGAKYVVLGINEWANLSESQSGDAPSFHGYRRILPTGEKHPVFIVHLPFLLGTSLTHNELVLHEMGWIRPYGENLVETNGNSCLLAKSAEAAFFHKLGFHPDSTRLSREVTVGFLQRGEALHALSQVSDSAWSVRQVLRYAGILPTES